MADRYELGDAWEELRAALYPLDASTDSRNHVLADELREHVVAAIATVCEHARWGDTVHRVCRRHRGQPAHNCGPCASERKGLEVQPPAPQVLERSQLRRFRHPQETR